MNVLHESPDSEILFLAEASTDSTDMTKAAETISAARAVLTQAGKVLSASRAQDLAFTLYDLAQGEHLMALQTVLSRTLTGAALDLREITNLGDLVTGIEAGMTADSPL